MNPKRTENTTFLRSDLVFPLLTNAILIVGAITVLWVMNVHYRQAIRETAIAESRFVTTEWHLLRELKAETDRRLEVKDQEIAQLRRRYADLTRQDASSQEREYLEAELNRAEEERAAILSERLDAVVTLTERPPEASRVIEPPGQSVPAVGTAPVLSPTTVALHEHVAGLEAELDEIRDRVETRAEALAAARVDREESERRITRLLEAISASRTVTQSTKEEVERLLAGMETEAEIARETTTTLDLVATRALMRAILDSPPIRVEYPGLARDVDRYFLVYGEERRRIGRREAYAGASRTLERIAGLIGANLTGTGPGDTAAGYRSRLSAVLARAFRIGVPASDPPITGE